MAHVVDYAEFDEFKNNVLSLIFELKDENEFLRSVILGQRWLTKMQTLKVLDVSERTLYRMTKENRIVNCKDGSKHVYDIDSVRSYLTYKKISQKAADDRLIKAFYEQKLSDKSLKTP